MSKTNSKLGTGKTCQCSVCGEYFSTVGNFDKHREGKHGEKVCVDPATVGLVIVQRGENTKWAMPGTTYDVR